MTGRVIAVSRVNADAADALERYAATLARG